MQIGTNSLWLGLPPRGGPGRRGLDHLQEALSYSQGSCPTPRTALPRRRPLHFLPGPSSLAPPNSPPLLSMLSWEGCADPHNQSITLNSAPSCCPHPHQTPPPEESLLWVKVLPFSQASVTKPSESESLKGSQVWRLPVAPTMGQGPTASWPPLWSPPYRHPHLLEEQKPMDPS